ncbi:MAG: adenylate/guanylate cyclase domain-containing protein [Coleofasciculaceae cyanobacterium]
MNQRRIDEQDREQLIQTTRNLLTEVQALSSRIAAVNEISTAINRSLNLDDILRIVGKQAKWLLDFKHCSVCLVEGNCCRPITLFGSPIAFDACISLEDNPIGRAVKTGQPQLNPQDYLRSFPEVYTTQIIIALENENQVIGTINFGNISPHVYTQEDLRIAYLLALQVSGAIRNAKHFDEMNQLLEEMNQLNSQLHAERGKTDELLLNILPRKIANELKQNGKVKPVHFEAASILFTDFKDFTKLAEQLSPEALVDELDYCFSYFDMVMESYNLEKLKTIGDSYMSVAGIPVPNATHAIDAVLAALQVQAFMGWRQQEKMQQNQPYWEMRIGIHSGSLLAGVIGKKKFAYDVWGDAVNIAARIESVSLPSAINISQTTYELVKDFFDCENRGKITVKNKGKIEMYFVNGIKKNLACEPLFLLPNDQFNAMYSAIK